MEKPNYILKANEAVLVPKNDSNVLHYLKIFLWVVIAIIIIGSLVFQDNLFSELQWTSQMLLISLFIGIFFMGGNKKIPSPFEIHFFDDYLIVYREKYYYSHPLSTK